MRKLETYIEKIEKMDYKRNVHIVKGKITAITFKCEKGTAVLSSTEKHFIFSSDFLKPFVIKKDWFESDISFNELDPKHYKNIIRYARDYNLYEKTDDKENYLENVVCSLKGIDCHEEEVWDIVNNDNSTIDDINDALMYYEDYDNEDIENLYMDYSEDYLTFMAILYVAMEYAKDNGFVNGYKPYDKFEHAYEVRKKDMDFVFQLVKDREHGNWNGDRVTLTKRGDTKYLFDYDDNMATISIVGRHPYLESWKVGERRIFER